MKLLSTFSVGHWRQVSRVKLTCTESCAVEAAWLHVQPEIESQMVPSSITCEHQLDTKKGEEEHFCLNCSPAGLLFQILYPVMVDWDCEYFPSFSLPEKYELHAILGRLFFPFPPTACKQSIHRSSKLAT